MPIFYEERRAMTPKLRFPEFVDKWQQYKLGDLSKIFDGTHQTPKYVNFGVPFYSVENVTADNFTDTKYISEEVYARETKRIERGDILMTRIGDIGTAKYIDWDVRASFYVSLALIKKLEKINNKFLSHYIASNRFQSELWAQTLHVAFPKKINLGDIGSCKVMLPAIEEQQKIAEFLTAVDERIELASRKVEKLETYKRGLTQKIFTRTLRFKRDDGSDFPEWEEKCTGDVGKVVTGKTPATSKKELWNGGLAFITPTDIVEGKKYQSLTERTVSEDYVYDILPIGTTVFTCIASIGKMAITSIPSVTNQQINSIIPGELIDQEFLFYAVQSIAPKIKASQASNTLPIINKTEFSKFRVPVPDKTEQQKIATFLSQIDEKITLEAEKLEELKKFKKALLQRMFV